jgi:hypothetical protein
MEEEEDNNKSSKQWKKKKKKSNNNNNRKWVEQQMGSPSNITQKPQLHLPTYKIDNTHSISLTNKHNMQ